MFIRMKVRKWEDSLEAVIAGVRFPIQPNDILSIGYCEVYDTLENLLKDHPDETYYEEVRESK